MSRETNEHGAVRDGIYSKPNNCLYPPRYDLVSPIGLQRLAVTYGEGAAKYGDHNWRQGFTDSSVMQHVQCHIEAWKSGDRSEDHLAHASWGLFTLMHFEREDIFERETGQDRTRLPLFDFPTDEALLLSRDYHDPRSHIHADQCNSVAPATTEAPSATQGKPAPKSVRRTR